MLAMKQSMSRSQSSRLADFLQSCSDKKFSDVNYTFNPLTSLPERLCQDLVSSRLSAPNDRDVHKTVADTTNEGNCYNSARQTSDTTTET